MSTHHHAWIQHAPGGFSPEPADLLVFTPIWRTLSSVRGLDGVAPDADTTNPSDIKLESNNAFALGAPELGTEPAIIVGNVCLYG